MGDKDSSKPRVLGIDLETYSDVDLSKCGLYRYVEGDFHILLFAYAFDDDDVRVIDMAQGEQIPQEVLAAIDDPAGSSRPPGTRSLNVPVSAITLAAGFPRMAGGVPWSMRLPFPCRWP